jgi:RNAse (barnase) inhibitor barstar
MKNEEKPLILDVSGILDGETFHEYLSKKCNFPGFYGYNFDALWDCLTSPDMNSIPGHVRIEGMDELENTWPEGFQKFQSVVRDWIINDSERKIAVFGGSPSGEGIAFEDET